MGRRDYFERRKLWHGVSGIALNIFLFSESFYVVIYSDGKIVSQASVYNFIVFWRVPF